MTTVRHPANAALLKILDAQPELSIFCTQQADILIERYGADRMVRMPIAENAMVGMAVGMALVGRRVLINIARAAFLMTAMDALVNHATKWRYMSDGQFSVPLVIRALTRGGEHLGAQHEHAPHAMLSQVPGLVVAVPSSPNSAAGLLASALVHPDPVVLLESPKLYAQGWTDLPEHEPSGLPLRFGMVGRARTGRDLTLVGIGNTVALCMHAAERLACTGIDAQVLDLRTSAPLDREGVATLVHEAGPAVLVDEAPAECSVMRDLGFTLLSTGVLQRDRIAMLTGASVPAPVSPLLLEQLLPSVERVEQTARAIVRAGRATPVYLSDPERLLGS